MEKKDFYRLHSEFCKTISNPKRQEILDALREKEKTVNELIEKTGISQSNLSQHLAILRSKEIVQARRDGTNLYYSITNKKIIKAYDLVSQVLMESLAFQNKTVKDAMNHKE
jgi:DNA-binding transcriptional ArsR family regulator